MGFTVGGTYGGFSGSVSLGGGGGGSPSSPQPTSCPGQKTSEIGWLMSVISESDRAAWANATGGLIGAGGVPVADKIMQNDAAGVAFDAAGGADCKVSSDLGRQFTAYTLSLLNKYEQATGFPQTPTIVTQPTTGGGGGGTSVTVSTDRGTVTANSGGATYTPTLAGINPTVLIALGIAAAILFFK